jgi:hypothetical protein
MIKPNAALTALVLLALVLAGCTAPPKRGLIDEVADPGLTEAQLQAKIDEFAFELVGRLEAEILNIIIGTDDTEMRLTALIGAIRINEEVSRAAMYDDPVLALIDLWALTVQIRNSIEQSTTWGEHQQALVEIARESNKRILAIVAELGSGERSEEIGAMIEDFAAQNPLGGGFFRPSVAEFAASQATVQRKNFLSHIGSIDDSVDRVARRLQILNWQLPKQLVWRAALLVERKMADLEQIVALASRAVDLVETLPETVQNQVDVVMVDVERQRSETIAVIDRQRETIFTEIDRQRLDTIEQIDEKVSDAFTSVEGVRMAMLADLETTIDGVFERVVVVRGETITEIDAIADRLLVTANDDAARLINMVFKRAFQLALVGFAGAVGLVVLLRLLRQRSVVPER